ncbi:hypothetical protein TNCT_143361 [Trichonephila clavata]|uniref:Uncharacterized protein n=1 Tax=Trichonephila clavata TaxID=2740835 RepID=A0A8X6FVD1_TRICU|nr:hypothetical protein TNCT_143361 [Trichonephila clavata]
MTWQIWPQQSQRGILERGNNQVFPKNISRKLLSLVWYRDLVQTWLDMLMMDDEGFLARAHAPTHKTQRKEKEGSIPTQILK